MLRSAARIIRRVAILLVIILAAFFILPGTSSACSPTRDLDWTQPTLQEKVNFTPVILWGKVTDYQVETITVQVQQYFKGTGPSQVIITGFGHGADCNFIAPYGENIFYTWPLSDNVF